MKFSKDFLEVLRVFSGINQNLYFREGTIQTSCVKTKSDKPVFVVRAKTDTIIEGNFAVGSLSNLINVLKLFDDADITVMENGSLKISNEEKEVSFRLTNPEYISYIKDPDKMQVGVGIEADLTEKNVVEIMQLYGIFDAKYISFVGCDGRFLVNIHSGENVKFSDTGSIEIGKTDEVFNATISANLFHIPKSNYHVVVSRKGYVYFANDVFEYFIPVNAANSSLGG